MTQRGREKPKITKVEETNDNGEDERVKSISGTFAFCLHDIKSRVRKIFLAMINFCWFLFSACILIRIVPMFLLTENSRHDHFISSYTGLTHRCEFVFERTSSRWTRGRAQTGVAPIRDPRTRVNKLFARVISNIIDEQ